MALVYFDASAFVKLLVEEDGSDLADTLWDACDAALSSRLSYPEVRAALAASHRNADLTTADLATAVAQWEVLWGSTRAVELTPQLERSAGELASEHALRGADALHLASALACAVHPETPPLDSQELVMAVWDRRLHAGAAAAGLRVAPTQLPV